MIFQVVCAANELGKELDPSNFFAAYSQINNSLEQMFIDLLLLMDSCKTNGKPEERAVVDLSGVIEALKAVTLKQSEGNCGELRNDGVVDSVLSESVPPLSDSVPPLPPVCHVELDCPVPPEEIEAPMLSCSALLPCERPQASSPTRETNAPGVAGMYVGQWL